MKSLTTSELKANYTKLYQQVYKGVQLEESSASPERLKRIEDSIKETEKILKKEKGYRKDLQDKELLNVYTQHLAKLQKMHADMQKELQSESVELTEAAYTLRQYYVAKRNARPQFTSIPKGSIWLSDAKEQDIEIDDGFGNMFTDKMVYITLAAPGEISTDDIHKQDFNNIFEPLDPNKHKAQVNKLIRWKLPVPKKPGQSFKQDKYGNVKESTELEEATKKGMSVVLHFHDYASQKGFIKRNKIRPDEIISQRKGSIEIYWDKNDPKWENSPFVYQMDKPKPYPDWKESTELEEANDGDWIEDNYQIVDEDNKGNPIIEFKGYQFKITLDKGNFEKLERLDKDAPDKLTLQLVQSIRKRKPLKESTELEEAILTEGFSSKLTKALENVGFSKVYDGKRGEGASLAKKDIDFFKKRYGNDAVAEVWQASKGTWENNAEPVAVAAIDKNKTDVPIDFTKNTIKSDPYVYAVRTEFGEMEWGAEDSFINYVRKSRNKKSFGESTELEEAKSWSAGQGSLSSTMKKWDRETLAAVDKAQAWMKKTGKSVEDAAKQFKLDPGELKAKLGLEEAKTIKVGEDSIGAESTIYALVKERMIMAMGEKEEMKELAMRKGGRVWLVNDNRKIGSIVEETSAEYEDSLISYDIINEAKISKDVMIGKGDTIDSLSKIAKKYNVKVSPSKSGSDKELNFSGEYKKVFSFMQNAGWDDDEVIKIELQNR